MNIVKKVIVPTGEIYVAQGDKGLIEFLTVGDYGKDANIKADFLGITRELNGVPNGEVMPLTEKWVVTVSTQYGCSMNCKFCDVPKVGKGRNAHATTLHEARETAQAKALQHEPVEQRIERFINEYPDFNVKIPAMELFRWHNILTGSCEQGRRAFAKDKCINLDTDEFTVKEFVKLTRHSYGGEVIERILD